MICGNLYGARVLVGDLQAASPLHDQLAPVSSAGSGIFLVGGIVDAALLRLVAAARLRAGQSSRC